MIGEIMLFIAYAIIIIWLIITLECSYRSWYWNDEGLFIDRWDYTPFVCEYPPIPPKTINATNTN